MVIRDPWLRALSVIAVAIAGVYLGGLLWEVFERFSDILLLFFLAWLLAFVLEPIVNSLQQAKVPRLLASGVTYLTLLVLLSLGIILLLPALTAQVVEIVRNLPGYAEQVTSWLTDLQSSTNEWLTEHRSPLLWDVQSALNPDELNRRIESLGPPLLANAVGFATGAAWLLAEILILLILSFYFMLDGPRLGEAAIRALPVRAQDDVRYLVLNIHRAFAGFLRGQVIQAMLSGLGTGIVMSAMRVEFALLAGVVAGVFLLIPFLGPVVAVVLPVAIAVFTRPQAAVLLFVVLFALQQVIFNVIGPRVLGRQVGLHPLLVLFAVLMGARIAGIWGALFGVPVVAVFSAMFSFYRSSRDERLARLQEHLGGQELVSAEPSEPPAAAGPPAAPSAPGAPLPR